MPCSYPTPEAIIGDCRKITPPPSARETDYALPEDRLVALAHAIAASAPSPALINAVLPTGRRILIDALLAHHREAAIASISEARSIHSNALKTLPARDLEEVWRRQPGMAFSVSVLCYRAIDEDSARFFALAVPDFDPRSPFTARPRRTGGVSSDTLSSTAVVRAGPNLAAFLAPRLIASLADDAAMARLMRRAIAAGSVKLAAVLLRAGAAGAIAELAERGATAREAGKPLTRFATTCRTAHGALIARKLEPSLAELIARPPDMPVFGRSDWTLPDATRS